MDCKAEDRRRPLCTWGASQLALETWYVVNLGDKIGKVGTRGEGGPQAVRIFRDCSA